MSVNWARKSHVAAPFSARSFGSWNEVKKERVDYRIADLLHGPYIYDVEKFARVFRVARGRSGGKKKSLKSTGNTI